jgi:anti-sigma28 factor (negative regulator of flagellin synthesis)
MVALVKRVVRFLKNNKREEQELDMHLSQLRANMLEKANMVGQQIAQLRKSIEKGNYDSEH